MAPSLVGCTVTGVVIVVLHNVSAPDSQDYSEVKKFEKELSKIKYTKVHIHTHGSNYDETVATESQCCVLN